jgi:hypothetical protein
MLTPRLARKNENVWVIGTHRNSSLAIATELIMDGGSLINLPRCKKGFNESFIFGTCKLVNMARLVKSSLNAQFGTSCRLDKINLLENYKFVLKLEPGQKGAHRPNPETLTLHFSKLLMHRKRKLFAAD